MSDVAERGQHHPVPLIEVTFDVDNLPDFALTPDGWARVWYLRAQRGESLGGRR